MNIESFIEEVQAEEWTKTLRDLATELITLQMEKQTIEKRIEEVKVEYINKAPEKMELWEVTISIWTKKTQTQNKDIDFKALQKKYPNAVEYKLAAKYIPKEEHSKYFTTTISKPFTTISWLPKAV